MVDGDTDVGVKEALHAQSTCEQGGLGEIFMLREGEKGAVEVLVRNKDYDVSTRVWPQ